MSKKIDKDYYDEDYFENGLQTNKSGYNGCVWEERYKQDACGIINYFKPKKVLDLGCSKGFRVRAFKEYNVFAMGCDLSEYAIKNCDPAVKNFVSQKDVGNPDQMKGYRTGAFDLILCFDILEHLTEPQLKRTLCEIKRILSNGGILITQMPMEKYDWDNDKSHIGIRPPSKWKEMLKGYDLDFFKPKAVMQYWTWTDPKRGLWFKKNEKNM